jgi:predicted transcriptional regulator YdeE
MELLKIKFDIQVMFIKANMFPNDVPDAFKQLEEAISNKTERRYFGYSQPNKDGVIIYKACAEILNEKEPEEYNIETMTIKAGNYASSYIKNHFEDGSNIPRAFEKLLKHPNLDPNGFCLEIYKNYTDPDVNCLVPILEVSLE